MKRDAAMTASDPQVSAWVAANAGSGKTYTLANRVARLLLADARPEKILCLTFTKAAAAEMQDRLFRQLGAWAMLPDQELRDRIAGIGGDAHTHLPKARRLFAAALETPGGLKVLTLHAFCQIVLSRFPIEAGIVPGFEVLDDQSAREMIADARQQVLERAGQGDATLQAAVSYLVTQTSEFSLTRILDAALSSDRRKLDRFLDGDFHARVRAHHGVADGVTTASIAQDFCASLTRDITILTQARDWLAGGSANDVKISQKLTAVIQSKNDDDRFDFLGAALLKADGDAVTRLATKALAQARPDLLDYLTQLQSHYVQAAEQMRAVRASDLAQAALTLIHAVRSRYAQAKRLRGVLDYDDLIIKTRDLLLRQGAAQWVLYKLDGGIDHVLIDEAQDTSPEQWAIVKALTSEFFAGAGAKAITRTIFAVGDEKQSIFGFQGADPSQFDLNRRDFEELARAAGAPFINQPLTTSRRSAPEILNFVDTVFDSDGARAGLTFSGAHSPHQAHRTTAKGGIEFWPALQPEETDEIDPWAAVDCVQAQSPVARLARQVADRISDWLNSGARLPDHDHAIQPRDIMILLPRRAPFGDEVIRQLKLRGVPVAGADRMRLTEQIAVQDLIALGRFVLQREDDLNLAALLRSPLCGLSDQDLFALAHDRKADLWRALVARQDDFADCHSFLSQMLERADYAPPFEFYSHALTRLGGRDKLLARLGMEAADAITEFLSLTLTHEQGQSPSLEHFLDWVSRGQAEIKRDMERGRNEVRVMTVHGAKGLEADIVILPDTTSLPEAPSRKGHLLYHDGAVLFPVPDAHAPASVIAAKEAAQDDVLREHRRLLYVALTRARDRLYVCGFEGKKGVKSGSWYELAQAAAQKLGVPVRHGDGEVIGYGTLDNDHSTPERDADTRPDALPAWTQTPAPIQEPGLRLIRPSDGPGFSPLGTTRLQRGLIVHALLARLPEIAAPRRAAIALAFARAHDLKDDAAQALVRETLAVLDDPGFADAFAPGSQAEIDLLVDLPELGIRIPGRIDRLAVTPDRVLILDYKTNRPPPTTEAQVAPAYLRQMALYRAACARIFPGRRIVCGLIFTDGPRLVGLSDAVLDAEWAAIQTA